MGSLSLTFVSESLVDQDSVRHPFTFALKSGFPSRLRIPLGTSDKLLEVCRPSQTAHLLVFSLEENKNYIS